MKSRLLWLIAFTVVMPISLYVDILHFSPWTLALDIIILLVLMYKWREYFWALDEMKLDAEYHKSIAQLLEEQMEKYDEMFQDTFKDPEFNYLVTEDKTEHDENCGCFVCSAPQH